MIKGREDVLARLATAKPGDAEAIAKQGQKDVLLKKSSARRSEMDKIRQKQAALRNFDIASGRKGPGAVLAATAPRATAGAGEGDSGLVKGLKKVKPPEPREKPYDPFGGFNPGKHDYYSLPTTYPSTYLDNVKHDVRVQAGGYDLDEYYSRTLLEAFAGLGCFVDQEASQR